MAVAGKKIGLFFGSFNPVHTGHMIIANYMVTKADLDEVWMVVSPHNPLKDKKILYHRYAYLSRRKIPAASICAIDGRRQPAVARQVEEP